MICPARQVVAVVVMVDANMVVAVFVAAMVVVATVKNTPWLLTKDKMALTLLVLTTLIWLKLNRLYSQRIALTCGGGGGRGVAGGRRLQPYMLQSLRGKACFGRCAQ